MRLLLLLLVFGLFSGTSLPNEESTELPLRRGQDYALFFPVSDYSGYSGYENLPTTIEGLTALKSELDEMYGFTTDLVSNASKKEIYAKLRSYTNRTFGEDDQLFIFFSGHGEFDDFENKGYFLPRSGPAIDLTTLGNIVSKIPCKHILLAIDACYSGTIDQKIAFQGGPMGRMVDNNDNKRRQTIELQLRNKSRLLLTSGGKEQTPATSGGSPFVKSILSTLRKAYVNGNDGLVIYKDLEAALTRVRPLPHYGKLPGHEDGGFVFVSEARPAPTPHSAPVREEVVQPTPPDNMIFIAGGTFQMGDQFGDGYDDEKPVHSVTLSDFYLGATEVTLAKFSEFIESSGYTTSAEKHGTSFIWTGSKWENKAGINWRHDEQGNERTAGKWNHPVIHVSWLDAVAYCNWRSKEELLTPVYTISGTNVSANWSANGYRLPTEAEWEYAARSGGRREKWSGTSSESDLTAYANKSGIEDGYEYTAPVGSFRTNGLGLSDMSGNVWEWCWDWKDSAYYGKSAKRNPKGPSSGFNRVIRGGSWIINSRICRTAYRHSSTPGNRNDNFGFRLARSF